MRPHLPDGYNESALEPLYFLPGGIGFDIGANVGTHTLAMAKSMAAVFAFEPEPRNYAALLDSIQSAGAYNVWPMCRALSNYEGVAEFRAAGGQSRIGADRKSEYDSGGGEIFAVPVCALDRLTFWLQRVDFIKIDVEGHEREVLEGAEGTLARFRPSLLIENHEQIEPGYGVDWGAIVRWLEGRGYEGFDVTHCHTLFRHREAPTWPHLN